MPYPHQPTTEIGRKAHDLIDLSAGIGVNASAPDAAIARDALVRAEDDLTLMAAEVPSLSERGVMVRNLLHAAKALVRFDREQAVVAASKKAAA